MISLKAFTKCLIYKCFSHRCVKLPTNSIEVGIHSEWDANEYSIAWHTHWQCCSLEPLIQPLACFWEVGGNQWALRKPSHTWRKPIWNLTKLNVSSGTNQRLRSVKHFILQNKKGPLLPALTNSAKLAPDQCIHIPLTGYSTHISTSSRYTKLSWQV